MNNNITTYQREVLTNLYATLEYLACNGLPGAAEITNAIEGITCRDARKPPNPTEPRKC